MNLLETFLIALGLSMDCFAVSLSFGAQKKLAGRDIFRVAFYFALFQGLMPVIGWAIGITLKVFLSRIDHWIAFGILTAIGLRMIWESFKGEDEKRSVDIRDRKVLLSLSLATSIDALISGLSFGFVQMNILLAISLIAVVTFLNSIAGALVGKHAIHISSRWAEIAGGLVLIGIGLRILSEHVHII